MDWQPMEDAPHTGEFQLRGSFNGGAVLIYERARRGSDFDIEVPDHGGNWRSVYGRSTIPFKALGWLPPTPGSRKE